MADTLRFVAGTVAVQVRAPSNAQENQIVTNSGPATAFLGQSGVTAGTGCPFPPGSESKLLKNGAGLFAITAAGVANIAVQAGVEIT